MKKPYAFLLIICLIFSCQKKQNVREINPENLEVPPPPKEVNENDIVGFACYESGAMSDPVARFSELLKNKDYSKVIKNLYNKNSAEKYLATVACEKLEQKNLIKLSNNQLNQIKNIKESSEHIILCSGCTNEEELTLKQMFTSEDNFLADSVEEWINEMIK